jgi:hypothetical protein
LNALITIISLIYTAAFSCPQPPSMATTQPTTPQPPNPTTDHDSEETPPTTNQQTKEPVDPPTTNGEEEKPTLSDPTDYRVTGMAWHNTLL